VAHEFAVGPADKVDADEIDGTIVKEARSSTPSWACGESTGCS